MNEKDQSLILWQNKILPFAIVLLTILMLVYIILYFLEVKNIQKAFLKPESYDAVVVSKALNSASAQPADKLYHAELISLLNRHYNVSLAVKSRILTLNLSFLTGMILCFMGGLFVLGKFSESTSSITAGAEKTQIAISSASPGIILSLIGVILIAFSIFSKVDLSIEDKPVYIHGVNRTSKGADVPGEVEENDTTANMIDRLKKNTLKKIKNDSTK